jgi:L-rhamnose isomerase
MEKEYQIAKEKYAAFNVDTDQVLKELSEIPVSLHCWQADDITGFEKKEGDVGGGLAVTGNFPGRASSLEELCKDLEKVLSLLPGKLRVNLHATYGDFRNQRVDRNELEPGHFVSWIEWAKQNQVGLDFNSTFFGHPNADAGFTLSHPDQAIREFWMEHARRCRKISDSIGKNLKSRCIHNIWIPDGSKDDTVSRKQHREWLIESLDTLFEKRYDPQYMVDSLESKLFGIGSESFVTGSFEFYLGYAITRKKMLCLDMGHFHPTESVADKVSAVSSYIPELLFHFSRGLRWDSDHVVTLNDPVRELTQELVRSGILEKSAIALDFFDATINRIGAYVVGTRSVQKSLLYALLEPVDTLRKLEREGKLFERLALLEELKTMPFGDVWNYYCEQQEVPPADHYIQEIQDYQNKVLFKR